MRRQGDTGGHMPSARQALLLLQLDAGSFGTGRQAESLVQRILERERHLGQEIASRLNAVVREEYVELGSGEDLVDHEAVMDLLADSALAAGQIDYVIVADIVHLVDSLAEVRVFYDAVFDAGAQLVPFRLDLNRSSPDPDDQRLLRDLSAFYAQQEQASGT